MIFTIYYMYATVLQWWRLGSLKNKLNGTLNAKNALLLSSIRNIHSSKRQRSIENLLFHIEDRIACTIIPKQIVNLSHWILFPKDLRTFPIHIEVRKCAIKPPFIYLMVRAVLDNYTKHESEVIQIEEFGELVAWKGASKFEVLVKTDLENLTKLVQRFRNSAIDINHDLEMLEMETVNIDGNANKIKYNRKYSLGETVKYSHSPVHWKKFAQDVKELYMKIRENSNPKIKIENGTSKIEDQRKVPVYEAKPIKKEAKKHADTLVVTGSEHRRHKIVDKREKISEDKHKTDKKTKDEYTRIIEVKSESTKNKVKSSTTKSELASKSDDTAEPPNIKSNVESLTKFISDRFSTDSDDTLKNKEVKIEDTEEEKSSKSKEMRRDRSKENKTDTDRSEQIREHRQNDKETIADLEKDKPSTSKSHKMKSEESRKNREKNKLSEFKDNRSLRKEKNNKRDISSTSISKNDLISKPEDVNASFGITTANVKPPNILVYADSVTAKENVKSVLNSVINREKYIVYDLPSNTSSSPVWSDTAALVVICGATTPELTSQLLHYLVNGGQLLCLCSDLLHSILSVFSTAEVREHELVRFSYGDWKRVKMMHHIFCYQASPAKKQFSKDSVESNHSNGSSPIAPRTPSVAEIQHNGKNYVLQVQVLGTEETWQTPSLLLANVKGSKGRAIFSQVHLEIDPLQYEEDENKFTALKDSNEARIEILTDILKNRLDIDCTNNNDDINYSPAYFLGRHDMKMEMINECKEIVDNTLNCEKISLEFCGKNVDPGIATSSRLPVMLYSCPSTFSTVEYFSTLNTDIIGRLVIYVDVLTSSQYLLSKTIKHGLVVIPRQQSAAVGRSNNIWLSPVGAACFSLQLHVPLSSPLGRMLSIVQQLVIVAIIEAIKNIPGYEKLNLGIKWPNDIYIDKAVKIGGLVVSSSIGNRVAVLNIGCGLNLNNTDPTTSLNDCIDHYNKVENTDLQRLSHEKYFALVFNEIENLYDIVQNDNMDHFHDLYYKHWIHMYDKIKIESDDGQTSNATILGIDDFGFLKVRLEDGEIKVVQPDGNTFDMIKGLIAPKPLYKK